MYPTYLTWTLGLCNPASSWICPFSVCKVQVNLPAWTRASLQLLPAWTTSTSKLSNLSVSGEVNSTVSYDPVIEYDVIFGTDVVGDNEH